MSVYGGELEAGPRADGGYSPRASFPRRAEAPRGGAPWQASRCAMTELPSGTVTFFFTDIEGSTTLLRRLRDRYSAVLADHRRILREAVEQAGGQEMETQGDGSGCGLRRPRDAVAAAVAAREALAQHPWPDGIDVRVRMGIHTGEAALDADGYLGLAVHRAARICAAGHGGQILLSQTAHTLLEDAEHEFPEVTVRDLGPQRLKDFDRPVRIYELVAANGARSFPPLKTLDSGEEKDPPFVGRESELAEAARRAAEQPAGRGGDGRTRPSSTTKRWSEPASR